MPNLNKVFLMGNLTRDPELKFVPAGTAVASFGLATNRTYTTQSGERKEEVCFTRVVVWGRQAEACQQYLHKGSPVFVEGRLMYRTWEAEGQKRSTLEVRADRVQFLERSGTAGREASEEQMVEVAREPVASQGGGGSWIGETGATSSKDDEVPF